MTDTTTKTAREQRERLQTDASMPNKTYRLPACIAAALSTGRPELVRLGVLGDPEEAREMLNEYAEDLVRHTFEQREVIARLAHEVSNSFQQFRGALATYERVADALRIASTGATSTEILNALENPRKRGEGGE